MLVKLETGKSMVVMLYVDDIIIKGDDNEKISHLREELSIRFEMKNFEEIGCFLGLEFEAFRHGKAKNKVNTYGVQYKIKEN